MILPNRTVKNLVILVLVVALLVPMFPAAKAEGMYKTIDFSQAVLASRINQKVSGDCAVVSMATIESFMHGAVEADDKETVYNAVLEANGDDNYAYWDNVGYLVYDYVDWEVIYERLTMGIPSIIHRTKGSNAVQHWSVVAGYNGSETELEWEKFVVVDVYLGSGLKDIKSAATWGSGCEINWMALRGNGMEISIYPKTLMDWGKEFYASIARKDIPGQLVSASQDQTRLVCAETEPTDAQRWHFTRCSDGGYVIENAHTGLVLTVLEESAVDGTQISLEKYEDPDYQHWFLYRTEVGYMLQSRGTGKAVSVYPAEENRNAELHTYNQSVAQILEFHIHEYTQTEVAATCEERAYTRYECAQCGDWYHVESEDPAPGHDWQVQSVKDADCRNTPMTVYACAVCQKTQEVYAEKTYSEWTAEAPEDMPEEGLEVKTQYRFRDRFSAWGEPEENKLLYVKQWPDNFNQEDVLYTQLNQAPKQSYQTEDQWLNVVGDEKKGYVYYHWCSGSGYGAEASEEHPDFDAFYSTGEATEQDSQTGAYYCGDLQGGLNCPYAVWYYRVEVYEQTYMLHKKTETTEQWTEWSAWTEMEVTPTDDRQVQTQELYRYVTNLGSHRYSGSQDTTCDVCGAVRQVAKIETTPMYRLYNPNSGEHFYTGSEQERDYLASLGWQYEGVAWNAPTNVGTHVFRLFNPNNGDHHYTMSEAERDMLVALGWQYEGVAWNSASSSNIPMYRLFNPNADCGSHHYTGSEEERDYLVSLGWQYEGIGWYGLLK